MARKPDPAAAYYVSQGKAVEKQARQQKRAVRQRTLAKALPPAPTRPLPMAAPVTLRPPSAAPQVKRAQRVQLSAQRKRIGYDRPILVKRRQKVATQQRGLKALEQTGIETGALAATQPQRLRALERSGQQAGVLVKRVPEKKKPAKGGLLAASLGATTLADKLLSGKTLAKPIAAAANIAGKGLEQAVTGEWLTKPLGLYHEPKGVAKGVTRVARGLGRDIVDIPANVVPSLYVPGKEVVTGHPGKAAKEVYAGAKETLTHPLDHPLGAALTVSGVGGAFGRGAGFAARTGALGKGAKGAAKTAREAKVIPGTRAQRVQPYSPDVLRKGVQVLGERRAAAKKGQPSKRRMGKGDIHSEVDDFIRTSRNVRGRAEERVTHEVAASMKHGKPRERRATAAHTVAVQGLANASKPDLQLLLGETERAGKQLTGEAKRQNERRVEHLRGAIKGHTPQTEAHIRETQKRYRVIDRRQEAEMVGLGILDRSKADVARYTPAAVRHGLHDPELAPVHQAMAKDQRVAATQEKGRAHRARLDANAKLREMIQRTRVSELGPRGKRHPDVQQAERALAQAKQAHADTHAGLQQRVAAAEAELTAARHDAAMTTTKVSRTPEVQRAQSALVDAHKQLVTLERQHAGTQRTGGRLEGRAQEQVAQANARARGHARAAARDVRRSADEVRSRTQALADLRKRGGTPKQLEAATKRLDLSRARHDQHVGRLRDVQRFEPGTHPRGTLARVEAHGAGEVELGQQIARARERVKAAELHVAKTHRRFQGVPPKQADRLRRAIIEQAQARLAHRQREGLANAADRVTHAEGRLAYERSKRGLDPAAADRLWKAIGEAQSATKRHGDAVAAETQAIARDRTLRVAPFIDRQGHPATVQDVASHPAMSGQPEPSFLPGAYERRVGAVPEKRINIANPQGRSGAMVAEGRTPVAGAHLLNARVERERLIEAAKSRTDFLDHFGFREGGKPDAGLARYGNEATALNEAGAAEKTTGVPMSPMHNQDGTWSLVPHDALKRLQDHEQAPTWADPIQRLGRQWRQGVLAFSAKWLTGQAGEGSLRTAIHQGFNPVRLARSHQLVSRTLDELKQIDPQAAARFETLYKRGGAGRTAAQSRQEAFHDFQMGESSGRLMQTLHDLERRPTAQKAGNAYGWWQKFMFEWMNGGIETAVRRGMVGRELMADPIFRDKGIVLDFQQAAKDLAEGQTNTAAQNRLARQVDDAFGKYQGRGPAARHVIENVTPFIPWFLSAMRFLGVVLPRDHPVLSGLTAAANQSSQEWRKKYGLVTSITTSPRGSAESVPLWQQGSLPIAGGLRNVSHFTPMGAMQSLGDLGSFLLPQYNDIRAASKGEDWRGLPLTSRDTPPSLLRIMEALGSAGVTTAVPPIGTAARVAGWHLPSEPDIAPSDPKTDLPGRVLKFLNPLPKGKAFQGAAPDKNALKLQEPLKLKGAEPLTGGGLVLK